MEKITYDNVWHQEIAPAITICDAEGVILYLNDTAVETFKADGGAELIGKSLFDCHSELSNQQIRKLLATQRSNCYTIEKNGVKKLIYQTPWYDHSKFGGLAEFSFEIPFEMPHFLR